MSLTDHAHVFVCASLLLARACSCWRMCMRFVCVCVCICVCACVCVCVFVRERAHACKITSVDDIFKTKAILSDIWSEFGQNLTTSPSYYRPRSRHVIRPTDWDRCNDHVTVRASYLASHLYYRSVTSHSVFYSLTPVDRLSQVFNKSFL